MRQRGRDADESEGLDAMAGEAPQSEPKSSIPQHGLERVTLDPSLSPEAIADIVHGEKEFARNGLVAGLITIGLGVVGLLLGVTGTVDITFQSGGTTAHVVTSMVGVVVALIGGAVVYLTRYRVDIRSSSTPRATDRGGRNKRSGGK